MKRLLYPLMICLVFAACVEEYKIPESRTTAYDAELVIQGRILAGDKSIIYITQTQPLNSKEEPESVLNAQVTIIGQNGYESELAEFDIEQNCYTIDTQELPSNTLYAVQIKIEGEIYQSEFQSIQYTPEIDEVSYKEKTDGITIHITTYGDEKASRFYMWTYEEDWEFHADINMLALSGIPLYSDKFYQFENRYDNPYYYCWIHNSSKNIHLYSTLELQENTAKNVELLQIPIDDIRISYIYSILVKQWGLSENAYNYYRTIELYSEESAGLFTPIPTDVLGNVSCISNPEKRVRGYVLASQTTTKRIFIYESNFKELTSEYSTCTIQYPPVPPTPGWANSWDYQMRTYGAVIYTKYGKINMDAVKYSKDCVDCRTVEGATKKRPDFWPTDHK
ncbi:MAG: DUF4249 domain-containing protein [Oscillospiraceae bacterium]|nr:DUF4249 domain-containing protein [Oscillospiraceae bacterium]